MTENDNRKLLSSSSRLGAAATLGASGRVSGRFTCCQARPWVPSTGPAPASLCAALWERAGPDDQGVWSDGRSQAAQEEGNTVHSETLPAPPSPCGLPDVEAGPQARPGSPRPGDVIFGKQWT